MPANCKRLVRSRSRERGDTFVELALVLIPLLALMLAIIDFSMPIFLKSTFSAAVREGCRFGVTYNLTFRGTTYTSQTAAIKAVVQNYSMGFLAGTSGASKIIVKYYSPVSPYGDLTGQTGANSGGNILEVSINNYTFTPIAPIWRSGSPFSISAISSDRLETLPAGTAPPAQ